ncbi:hypothetical protein [Desulfurobacterium atlanticum]|uniref:Uncharacterized protein n=1 Tax=Desulfurobacterium atlanticum TaxID=240169 RepID=A0A238ZB11_9BACT|nr:hypothetical protein [Desulfurobacterium atlanticum]SNR79973.1 hypothetical protein SAMN06265340_10750 [Desulfurobacterium atlanticum]
MDEKQLRVKGLAYRGLDLWLNLELSKFRPDSQYEQVNSFIAQRFKTDNPNPLLKILGLLEMALIEDALSGKNYFTEEEREQVIKEVVESLAKDFPDILKEIEKMADDINGKITQLKELSQKYRENMEEDECQGK